MIGRVASFAERHRMFAPASRVGVAVSGGADSVCLLETLVALAPRWNLRLTVLHLDHRLRGEESCEDARFVARLAERHGLAFDSREIDVAALAAQSGGNLEQTARDARRGFFLDLLGNGALDRVALGHTLSDQAETVLYRMLRGAGPQGLAAMLPVRPDGIVRPLLAVTRAEVEKYLRSREIVWREDRTNADARFARNRIRQELLPRLARDWNPALAETLARMASVMQEEEAWWSAEVDRIAPDLFHRWRSALILDAARLATLHRAVARRLVRRAIELVKGDLRSLDFAHVEQALELALRETGDGRVILPGVDVMRSFDRMRLAPPAPASQPRNYRIPVTVPGRIAIPGAAEEIVLEWSESGLEWSESGQPRYNESICLLDFRSSPPALELRNWRPGDAYRPVGHRDSLKIKTLFQQARVPLWERRGWPVLVDGERIVWARKFGAAAETAAAEAGPGVAKVSDLADIAKTWNLDSCL